MHRLKQTISQPETPKSILSIDSTPGLTETLQNSRNRLRELLILGRPLPEITDEMKLQAIKVLGNSVGKKIDPNNIEAYYTEDGTPAFCISDTPINTDVIDGISVVSWGQAWTKFLTELEGTLPYPNISGVDEKLVVLAV